MPAKRRTTRRTAARNATRRAQATGRRPAPNAARTREVARQRATALLTAVHDGDPALITAALSDVRSPQAWVTTVAALLHHHVVRPCAELGELFGTSAAEELAGVLAGAPELWDGEARAARDLAVAAVATADGDFGPDAVADQLVASTPADDLHLLVDLALLAGACTQARAEAEGQDWQDDVQRHAHGEACGCHNEIDADVVEDHVEACLAARLSADPDLLRSAASRLRRKGSLPRAVAEEFADLGGTARLEALAGTDFHDLDDDDARLVVLALLDAVMINPDGATVAERVELRWRA
ncbi:hypothetical protein [Quadrisphaera sp. KR29]|uniref:hypothetical protein n=1 Tax=Quadrisphaera sp. KR29 TaxID=3461391 RepID=UPI00404477D7